MADLMRQVRTLCAQVDRSYSRQTDFYVPYAWRRLQRRLRRRLFSMPAFLRIAEAIGDPMAIRVFCTGVLSLGLVPTLLEKDARAFIEAANKARSEVEIAARILRRYAATVTDETERIELENAAVFITMQPSLASGDSAHDGFDWRHMGQKLSNRAFAIRHIAAGVPETVPDRYAAIADLVRFVGYDSRETSPQLVRSTLLKGRT